MGLIKKGNNKHSQEEKENKSLYFNNIKVLDPVLSAYAKALQEGKTFGIYIHDNKFKESAIFSFKKILNTLKRRNIDIPEHIIYEVIVEVINERDGDEDKEGRIIYKHYGISKYIT